MRPRPGRDAHLLLLLAAACTRTPAAPPPAPAPASGPVAAAEPVPSTSHGPPVTAAEPVPATSHGPPAAATAPVPATSHGPPVAATAPVPAASPTTAAAATDPAPLDPPLPDLLGRPRRAVEARLGPPRGAADGWVLYGRIDLQFSNDRSVRARLTAPESLDCAAIPAWAGILNPVGHPLRRAATCEWPGVSERHRLTADLAASHDLATHRLEVWLRD